MGALSTWSYRTVTRESTDISGFAVEARDGGIGKVDEATYHAAAGWVVVDTGPWVFGRKVMLPAGTIERIDYDAERVYVDRARDEIKSAPGFHASESVHDAVRGELADHATDR